MNEDFINKQLEIHEKRICNHGDRIDQLEQYKSRSEVQISNLCKEIESLVKTIKWAMGTLIVTLGGFIIWYIQSL